MAGEPILIVDDTPVNLKLTRILLVNEGYKVLTAASAEEALELLAQLPSAAHPGRYPTARHRRAGDDPPHQTGRAHARHPGGRAHRIRDEGRRAEGLEAGCDGYITKPIDTRSLGGRIRELLDRIAATPCPRRAPGRERGDRSRRRDAGAAPPLPRRRTRNAPAACWWNSTARSKPPRRPAPCISGSAPADFSDSRSISRLAREVETLLHERPVDTAQVRESLTNLVLAFTTPRGGARHTPPRRDHGVARRKARRPGGAARARDAAYVRGAGTGRGARRSSSSSHPRRDRGATRRLRSAGHLRAPAIGEFSMARSGNRRRRPAHPFCGQPRRPAGARPRGRRRWPPSTSWTAGSPTRRWCA